MFFLFVLLCFNLKANKVDSLESVLKTAKVDTVKVDVYNQLSWAIFGSNPDKALYYANISIILSKRIKYAKGLSEAYKNKGVIFYVKGNLDSSIVFYNKSFEIKSQIKDSLGLASVYTNIGLVNEAKGDYKNCLENYLKALKIFESLDDKDKLAKVFNNIGSVYFKHPKTKENLDNALSYFEKSLKIREELNDKKGIGSSLYSVGLIYFTYGASIYKDVDKVKAKENLEKALLYFERSLKIRREINDKSGIALTLTNIGSAVYASRNNMNEAEKFYKQALEIEAEIGDKKGIVSTLFNMAYMAMEAKDYNKALDVYNKSLIASREIGLRDFELNNYDGLATVYERLNNFKEALFFYKKYAELKDSLLNFEIGKQMSEMQTKYDVDKKEKTIELLVKQKQLQDLEIRKNSLILYSVIGGLVLLFIVIVSILYAYKQKKRIITLLKFQNTEITERKIEIEKQKDVINTKNKLIMDSIKYAQKIQESILPPASYIHRLVNENFVFFKPKDIVSGDFYWVENRNGFIYIATVDCTGHGVPGAFMSIVGNNLLNQAIYEKNMVKPFEILNCINNKLIDTFKKYQDGNTIKDGMVLSLVAIDKNNMRIEYAGSSNHLYMVRNKELSIVKADAHVIGIPFDNNFNSFTNHEIEIEKGDAFYIFSDGFPDQFGGPKRKRFLAKRLGQTFIDMSDLSMCEQKQKLEDVFDEWKGENEQIDDVLVIGFRV